MSDGGFIARGRDRWLAFITTAALIALGAMPSRAFAAGQSVAAYQAEYQVKAAFLFNFLKFVEWPDEPSADLSGKWVIGFVGESPIGPQLNWLAGGKSFLGRKLVVKYFQPTDDLRSCNILYINASERKHLAAILARVRGSSVLTVADTDDFIESGGMVQFVLEGDHVRFAIDVAATGRARLKVSSKLLALARVVTGAEPGATN